MTTNSPRRSFYPARYFPMVLRVVVSLGILTAGGVSYFVFGQKPEIPTDDGSGKPVGTLVQSVTIQEYNKPIMVKVDGEATTYRVISVGAEVSGRIEKKADRTRSGHFVQKGDLLFKIDDAEYRIELERQQALLAQIDEELRAINVELDNLSSLIELSAEDLNLQRGHLDRVRNLFDRKATSETDYDNARQQELAARNALQKLKNELSSKERERATTLARRKVEAATLKRVELNLAHCVITSPISGRVIEDEFEEGNFVTTGQTLVRISDASHMEVRCQFQPSEIAWVWQQQVEAALSSPRSTPRLDPIELRPVPCQVVYEFSGIETTWKGTLSRFDGMGLSRETRTFPARVIVENPEETTSVRVGDGPISIVPPTLLSGMFVSVRIPVELNEPLLSVPVEAVRPGGKLWINDHGKLQIQDVAVAKIVNDQALLRPSSSVNAGQKVVVSPLPAVTNGMILREESDDAPVVADSTNRTDKVQP
ncbi:efflux RND transporter periplasmic adaptor subunit [Thalassoglobus sp.]|uniref:efflux RND transporter periplasmic adaptor subunit n=1 Tax=Thalassoglobus sp. TaxID=2795869 RepID=UPI003AA84207